MVLCFDIRAREKGVRGQVEVHIQRSAVSVLPLTPLLCNALFPLPFSFLSHAAENMDVIQKRTFPKTCAPVDPTQPDGSERQVALAQR